MRTDMSVNSSSSYLYHCFNVEAVSFISIAFNVTKILLLLPLSVLVLYLGYRQWRRRSSSATTRHCDVFTFQAAAMELLYAFGSAVALFGILLPGFSEVFKVGSCMASMTVPGQICFHILTCVERYLAVVHPVTYLALRRSAGVKIRNVSVVGVWLLCFGWSGLSFKSLPGLPIVPYFCLLIFSLIVVTFCCLCVLCVLIRPRPGEVGGDSRERVDRSKRRAFHTINAIMTALWLWFVGLLVCLALDNSELLSDTAGCLVLASGFWFILPSSLVLPTLFLLRARTTN